MILCIGGGASGKSEYAEKLLLEAAFADRYYIAAMEAKGAEAARRIQRHRKMRAGKGFITLEFPRNISACTSQMQKPEQSAALVECISNLTANEMFTPEGICEQTAEKIIAELQELDKRLGRLIVVTNNVFEDGGEYDPYTAIYMEQMAKINAALSREAEEVYELVLGLPLRLK